MGKSFLIRSSRLGALASGVLIAGCVLLLPARPTLAATEPATAADAHEIALEHFENAEFDRAARVLEAALEKDPDNASLHYLLGTVYRQIIPRRLDEASAQMMEALRLDPGLVEAVVAVTEIWVLAGRRQEAEQFLRQRVEQFPTEATALWQLGALLQEEGRYEDGKRFLQRAMVADPWDSRIWLEVGRGSLRSGDPDGAIFPLERARELDPVAPAVRYSLSQAYLGAGRLAEGEAEMMVYRELTRAREKEEQETGELARQHRSIQILEERQLADPERPIQETIDLTGLYRDTGSIDKGRAFFERLSSLRPERASPMVGLALLERRVGRSVESWELLLRARELEPRSAAVLGVMTDLAATPAQQQDLEKALLAMQDDPEAPGDVPLWLGILAMRQGNLQEAEAAFGRVLERSPGHPAALQRLASVYSRTGRDEQALGIYRDLVQDDPENGRAWFRMAQVEDRLGRREAATTHLERALQAGERQAYVLNLLGQLYLQAGESAKALVVFERSLVRDPDQPEIEAVVKELQSAAGTP